MLDLCTSQNMASYCAKEKDEESTKQTRIQGIIDIRSFKHASRGENIHWLIADDEFSDCSHSLFMSKKSDQIKMIPMWIKVMSKNFGIEIKRTRLDNSGENRSLQKECDKCNLGVICEFTTPGTPSKILLLKGKYKH